MYPTASVEITFEPQADDPTPAPTIISIRQEQTENRPALQQSLTTWIERTENAE